MTDFDAKAREIAYDARAKMADGSCLVVLAELPKVMAAALKAAYNEGLEDAIKATNMGGLGRIAVRSKKVPT